ncbi:hypothetical protein AYK81_00475 [Bacillus thuringiensis]|nr:hypothetical protein AYK81_00475 [Bacillus thuringiensis]
MSFFGNLECWEYPERQNDAVDKKTRALEWVAAEWWVRYCYNEWFVAKYPVPNHVTWQLDRLFYELKTDNPVLKIVMKLLDKDFKTILSSKNKLLDIMKDTEKSDAVLMPLLYEIKMGGHRKPDMLGISVSNTLLFDAVEVATVKTADETWYELQGKLDTIKNVIVPQLKLLLPEVNENQKQSFVQIPNDYIVKGSSFRLSAWQRILPLPIKFDERGKYNYVDWICYNPTMNWKPPNAPEPTLGPEGPQGTDGIVLYHIHRAIIPAFPEKIESFIKREFFKWSQANGLVPELNPAFAYTFKESQSAWSPEARTLFACFGIGALVMMGLVLASEIGIITGAATIAKGGFSALMTSPTLFLNAIGQGSIIARNLWVAGTSVAPLLPIFQH